MIAAGKPDFRLIGASVTGMGAVIRRAARQRAGVAAAGRDRRPALRPGDQVMFGPEFTRSPEGVEAAHAWYAPVPVRELVQAPQWPDDHLPGLAPRLTVPVHNALAEVDALWDSAPGNVEQFAKLLRRRRSSTRRRPVHRSQHRPSHPRPRAAPEAAGVRRGLRPVGEPERGPLASRPTSLTRPASDADGAGPVKREQRRLLVARQVPVDRARGDRGSRRRNAVTSSRWCASRRRCSCGSGSSWPPPILITARMPATGSTGCAGPSWSRLRGASSAR